MIPRSDSEPGGHRVRRAGEVLVVATALCAVTACTPPLATVTDLAPRPAAATATPTPSPTPAVTPTLTATPTPTPTRRSTTRPQPKTTTPEIPPPPAPAWIIAPGGTGVVGSGTLFRYRVEVEPATGIDAAGVAEVVDSTLGGPLGWTNGAFSFQRVSSGTVEMIVRLATPATVDRLCAPLQTNGQVSCRMGSLVVLNQVRWENGMTEYEGDLSNYRILLINHEVGHRLGRSHVTCPGAGLPQPVMMQIFYAGLQGCLKNVWPYAEDGTHIG